ncbi:MAG: argininosuccinate lyase [Deltaproteobacteria bacterium]|nr:argininosuccinate lyase [Deltaproteobacteria bacterium]
MVEKLWGSRFDTQPPKEFISFISGRDVTIKEGSDFRLVPYDVWGSRVHVIMLVEQSIISKEDGKALILGLREILNKWEKGEFKLEPEKEDVKLGMEKAGKLHTGRSRNDQITLDMILYLREESLVLLEKMLILIRSIVNQGKKGMRWVMPGFTHHQHASVTTFGHIFFSFAEALIRDCIRLEAWYRLFNRCPLGGAAGYGTSFPVDRKLTAELLAFDGPTENSLDPINNRWEPEAHIAFVFSAFMNHLSTIAQTLILMSTREFNMIRLDDRYSAGSSIMPQKRNPVGLEIIKAKAAYIAGALSTLLSIGQSLMVGYNRDTQWTKYIIMDIIDEVFSIPTILKGIIESLSVNRSAMELQCSSGFITAPALMEYIIQKWDLPFREGKILMEKAVKFSEKEGKERITLKGLKAASAETGIILNITEKEIEEFQQPSRIVSLLKIIGGPSETSMREELASLSRRIRSHKRWYVERRKSLKSARDLILKKEEEILSS